jgi:4-hydroxybenzoate polyprenyltransferase
MPASFASAAVLAYPEPVRTVKPPLCVDLDGTLILSDVLLESLMLLIKLNPLYLFLIPIWLLRGRAALKAELSALVTLDPGSLPYDRDFIDWLESERIAGRSLWLCTASNEMFAGRVAAHLGIFQGVLASDRDVNLAGATKAARLVAQFGEGGFDYCGNERRDIAVWKHARGAIVVHGTLRLKQAAARHVPVLRIFPRRASALRAVVRALRPHHWAKNVLILVPLLASHRVFEPHSLAAGLLATAVFCLCTSSVYVLNDLLDLESDRIHPSKRRRPFAAGDLSILSGLALAFGLIGGAFVIATFLTAEFQITLATYYSLTVIYSVSLKRVVLVDAVALAGLYTLRIIAGSAAIGTPLSFWLLSFSVFLFLSLAFLKRFVELDALRRLQRLRAVGRDYEVQDLPVLQSLGIAAGYMSVVVLALYINSPEIGALYRHPNVIWIVCVLMLYWISRMWIKAQRGEVHDDPVAFALKDRNSLAIVLLAAIAIASAI